MKPKFCSNSRNTAITVYNFESLSKFEAHVLELM